MGKRFTRINFSLSDDEALGDQSRLRKITRDITDIGPTGFSVESVESADHWRAPPGAETAGRMYLQTYLEDSQNEDLNAATSPDRPELVPNMRLVGAADVAPINSRAVAFEQLERNIPIFGARVTVDVGSSDHGLVSINGQVAPPPDISPVGELSAKGAADELNSWAPAKIAEDAAPILTWFLSDEVEQGEEGWHLCWHFERVALTPPESPVEPSSEFGLGRRHCCGTSPRSRASLYDVLVDAHDGEIVYYFSSTPALNVPIPMTGHDVDGNPRQFMGLRTPSGFALSDPLRNIITYDYGHQDIDATPQPPLPSRPVGNASTDLSNTFGAAVSAHHNATCVFDFYNDVLKRDGVDDRGMQLVSVVNVWSSLDGTTSPEWKNAVWWQNRMWYGQTSGRSLAGHLDIIAHELTHGVTQSTSNLVYRDIPGALNESFSDIFGVIIANWYPNEPEPLSTWTWEIGGNLGSGGQPLRDFSNPAAANQPDHWSQYRRLPASVDYGGVHIYSGIHNKAIYNLLSGTDANGDATFPVRDAALLLYLTLTRLTRTSDFHDSRRTLESVTRAYYVGDPATRQVRLAAIAKAFSQVGL